MARNYSNEEDFIRLVGWLIGDNGTAAREALAAGMNPAAATIVAPAGGVPGRIVFDGEGGLHVFPAAA
jgi:hypothetical protein